MGFAVHAMVRCTIGYGIGFTISNRSKPLVPIFVRTYAYSSGMAVQFRSISNREKHALDF
jgi:hypothetical protein